MYPTKLALEQRLHRLQSYCAIDANNLNLLRECIDVQYQLGHLDAARTQSHAALDKFPGDDALQFQLATVEMASNHPERTCELLHGLLTRGFDNSAVRHNLAYALGLCGKPQEGVAVLDARWAVVCRELPGAPLLKAKLQHHHGDVKGAIATLRQHVDTVPDDADGNGYLALLLSDEGDHDAAAQCAQRALTGNSEQYEAQLAQGMMALALGDAAQARMHFERIAGCPEEGGRGWLGLGLSEMALGELTAGEQALAKAVQLMPRHVGSWNTLAWAQISQSKFNEAEATLEHALALDRSFSENHGSLAIVQIMQGNLEAARRSATRAERLDRKSFSAAFANSLLMAEGGDQLSAQNMLHDIMRRPLDGRGRTLNEALQALRTEGLVERLRVR